MIVDDVKIKVTAGKGGDGAVAFNKTKMSLGPTGTYGGRGGSIYMEGVSDISVLNKFRFKKDIKADNGKNSRGQFRDGEDGKDIILQVPVGTVISNISNDEETEILEVGQKILVAKGGRGGRGNYHFRSSKNTSPKEFEEGKPGENFELHLELKFLGDVGLVGLPNVGKSSLINELTNSKSKVANYHFTTLEPNLGDYYGKIIVDIPGIIEGASEGKGLGIKFLKHIERIKIIFHLISAESEDPVSDYKVIRKELENHSEKLLEKEEHVFLSKSDEITEKEIKEKLNKLKKEKINATSISLLKPESLEKIKSIINKI
ncbi:MAG: Obg family GTPase CgtA [Candidatus Paceibacterota bacterium]